MGLPLCATAHAWMLRMRHQRTLTKYKTGVED
jgi:hypothetical protein